MGWRSGQAYSEDLRAKVLAAVDRSQGVYSVAAFFGVSVSYIYKALARRRASGVATSLPRRGQPGRKLDGHLDALRGQVAAHPDATLAELVAWARRQCGVRVSVATMWCTLDALGITRKKRHAMPPSRNARTLLRHDGLGENSRRA
jgi:transposase